MSLVWLFGGVLVGLLNALAMSVAVRRLTPAASAKGLHWITGGMAARWVFTAAFLVAALRQGAGAGLLAFAGLWLARWAAVGWWYRARNKNVRRSAWKP